MPPAPTPPPSRTDLNLESTARQDSLVTFLKFALTRYLNPNSICCHPRYGQGRPVTRLVWRSFYWTCIVERKIGGQSPRSGRDKRLTSRFCSCKSEQCKQFNLFKFDRGWTTSYNNLFQCFEECSCVLTRTKSFLQDYFVKKVTGPKSQVTVFTCSLYENYKLWLPSSDKRIK